MNLEQLGPIIKNIRIRLEMSQSDLAEAIKCDHVVSISRIERGVGGTFDMICDILSFFKSKGIRSHMIFEEPFDEELLYTDPNKELVNQLRAISGMVAKLK